MVVSLYIHPGMGEGYPVYTPGMGEGYPVYTRGLGEEAYIHPWVRREEAYIHPLGMVGVYPTWYICPGTPPWVHHCTSPGHPEVYRQPR